MARLKAEGAIPYSSATDSETQPSETEIRSNLARENPWRCERLQFRQRLSFCLRADGVVSAGVSELRDQPALQLPRPAPGSAAWMPPSTRTNLPGPT